MLGHNLTRGGAGMFELFVKLIRLADPVLNARGRVATQACDVALDMWEE